MTMSKESMPKGRSKATLWLRRFWAVFRHFLVPLLCVLGLFAGMIIGYVVIGDQPFSEAWKIETWKHVFDLVFS